MDDDESADFARVDSWLQSTVPSIPKCMAIFCLILNIIIPGSGTITGGLLACCWGRPRYDFRPAKYRCPTSLLVIAIGLAQMLSTVFMLVGWLWSIIWGVLMINLSGEEFRKTPSPPPDPRAVRKEAEQHAKKVEEAVVAVAEEEAEAPRGKKNFMKLVSKAADNKDQAIHGPSPSSHAHPLITPDNNHFQNNLLIGDPAEVLVLNPAHLSPTNNTTTTTKKSLSFVNVPSSDPVQPTAAVAAVDDASGTAGNEEGTPLSIGSKYSIFGCFRGQDHILHERFIRMMRGGSVRDSRLLQTLSSANDSPPGGQLRAFVHNIFKHWKSRARLRTVKVNTIIEDPSVDDDDDRDSNTVTTVNVIGDEAQSTNHAVNVLPQQISDDNAVDELGAVGINRQQQQMVTLLSSLPMDISVKPKQSNAGEQSLKSTSRAKVKKVIPPPKPKQVAPRTSKIPPKAVKKPNQPAVKINKRPKK